MSERNAYIAVMRWTLLAAALMVASAARADDDQDRATEALERSEVLPLAQLLPAIEARYSARLLAVEFYETSQGYVYELELITPDGEMFELPVDAATGAILPKGFRDLDGPDGDAGH
jgi:uncharacterized membrane protein YkoI